MIHPVTATTTQLLRQAITTCAACRQSLDGHTYRFFSCHPDLHTPACHEFENAAIAGNWANVHGLQTPSVGQPQFIVYAIACPGKSGGMVALLRSEAAPEIARLQQQALSTEDFANLRALCPTCQWIGFTPALQSGKEAV
jgi:hypothetical protein